MKSFKISNVVKDIVFLRKKINGKVLMRALGGVGDSGIFSKKISGGPRFLGT